MVLRGKGWRFIVPAAVCFAAAGICSVGATDFGGRPVPPGEVPVGSVSGTQPRPRLSWGGPVPQAPLPGRPAVYVPSPSLYSQPVQPTPQPFPNGDFTTALPPTLDHSSRAVPLHEAEELPSAPVYEEAPETGIGQVPGSGHDTSRLKQPPEPSPEPDLGTEEAETELYVPIIAENPGDSEEDEPFVEDAALPPLAAPVAIDDGTDAFGYAAIPREDPWAGLKEVTPGAVPAPKKRRPPSRQPSYASLERMAPPRRASDADADALPGRGALEDETPSGYTSMPRSEMLCRRALQKLGVRFVDAASIQKGRNCGIDHPVKVSDIAPGIAVRPAATLNCAAALRVAQWMADEVKPAARWKLLKRPTVLINASSYRCSRIAGSRSVSEHASGNALDVRGFKFSDGSVMEIEKKGVFELRQKAFQKKVRESACRYFGTVLGPGYNEDHADHLHLDAKKRRRGVCK